VDVSGLLVIAASAGAGWWLRRNPRVPSGSHRVLNAFVLNVSLPALVLVKMHAVFRDPAALSGAWVPVSMAWIQFGLASLFGAAAGRALGLTRGEQGALTLTMGLGNTSFVGFPLLEALFGAAAIPIGVLVDQPGSFLAFSTLGVVTAKAFAPRVAGQGTQPERAPFLASALRVARFRRWRLSFSPWSFRRSRFRKERKSRSTRSPPA
jgi:predicted permease